MKQCGGVTCHEVWRRGIDVAGAAKSMASNRANSGWGCGEENLGGLETGTALKRRGEVGEEGGVGHAGQS